MKKKSWMYVLIALIGIIMIWPGFNDALGKAIKARKEAAMEKNLSVEETSIPSSTPEPMQTPEPLPAEKLLTVPIISQNPELYNGCEITSVAMMLKAAGHPVDKMTLAKQVAKDSSPIRRDENGNILSWGDPNEGFVGDVTGERIGFSVYHGPVYDLVESILPGRTVDLTGESFDRVLQSISEGQPVLVWINVTFASVGNWVTWNSKNSPVKATFSEHAVLLVGYDEDNVYVNDPLDGTASKKLDRKDFIDSWIQMGSQAITYIDA
ncbi:C39 family peptidase [Paenibacillus larvae]